MAETPDFDRIARTLLEDAVIRVTGAAPIAEQLRLIWNARGAADIATLDTTITYALSGTESGLVKHLDQAIRKLDR